VPKTSSARISHHSGRFSPSWDDLELWVYASST
jgi:hypothetical protein